MQLSEKVAVAAAAWEKVKPSEDPSYNECALSHKENLVAQVEAVVRTGSATNPFEKAAKEILDAKAAEASGAKAETEAADEGSESEDEPDNEPEASEEAAAGPEVAPRTRKPASKGRKKQNGD